MNNFNKILNILLEEFEMTKGGDINIGFRLNNAAIKIYDEIIKHKKVKKDKIKKSCNNCKHSDICIFRMKLYIEFSGLLRNGIGHWTLNKICRIFAKDCTSYKKEISE